MRGLSEVWSVNKDSRQEVSRTMVMRDSQHCGLVETDLKIRKSFVPGLLNSCKVVLYPAVVVTR